MTTPHRHGIGLVGTGIMGRRMLGALDGHARWRVAALWDPSAAALDAAAAATPGARRADSLADLATDAAVDCVYVASPPAAHRAAVDAALDAGKAVLCEKPLAADVVEAQALRDRVAAAGLPFAVNFPFARSAAGAGLVELVRDGRLGSVERATVRVRFARWPRAWQAGASDWLDGPAEGGFTREVLSHFVFLALRLFGPASVGGVRLQREPGRSETALQARLHHAGGVEVAIDAAVGGEIADDNRIEVVGSRGTAVLSGWSRLEHDGTVVERADGNVRTLTALAEVLDGGADPGLASVDEALAVVRCVEGLLAG